jgi:hypothetical protein
MEGQQMSVQEIRHGALAQYMLWLVLNEWQGRDHNQGARTILNALLREWRRLQLAVTPPEMVEPRIIDRTQDGSRALRSGQAKYLTPYGQPAGRIPWLQ